MKSLCSKSVPAASPPHPLKRLSHRAVASCRLTCHYARPRSSQEDRPPSSDVSSDEIRVADRDLSPALPSLVGSYLQPRGRREGLIGLAAVAATSLGLAATAAPALAFMGTTSDALYGHYGAIMDMGLTIPGKWLASDLA